MKNTKLTPLYQTLNLKIKNNKSPVEIFDLHGGSYFMIFANCKLMHHGYKEDINHYLELDSESVNKKCRKELGLKDNKGIQLVYYDLYSYEMRQRQAGRDFDYGTTETYQDILDIINANGPLDKNEIQLM